MNPSSFRALAQGRFRSSSNFTPIVRTLATMSAKAAAGVPIPPPCVDESVRAKVHPDACLNQPPEYW